VSGLGIAMNTRNLFVFELILIDPISVLPERWQELQKISSGDT